MNVVGSNIGQKIKKARFEKGMTQEDLAGKDFNRSFLSQIEKGIVKPSDRVLSIIAKKLNLPISYFYEPEDPDKDDLEAINALKKSKQLLENKEYSAAHKLLENALKLQDISPKYAGLLMKQQGEIFFQENEIKMALSSLKKAKIIFSDYKYHHELCAALDRIGQMHIMQNKFDNAVYALQQSLKIIEDHFVLDDILSLNVYYNLASSLIGSNKYHEAIDVINQALLLSSKNNNYYNYGEFHYLLGQCYYGIHKLTKARHAFETAIDQFVIFNNDYYTGKTQAAIGDLEETDGNLTLASRYYYKAYEHFHKVTADTQSELCKLKLLKIYLQLGDKESIIKLSPYRLDLINSINEKLNLSYYISKVYHEQGDTEICLEQLNNLTNLLDHAKRKKIVTEKLLLFYYSWLGHIYLDLEHYDSGKKCLKQCSSIIRKLQKHE